MSDEKYSPIDSSRKPAETNTSLPISEEPKEIDLAEELTKEPERRFRHPMPLVSTPAQRLEFERWLVQHGKRTENI